MPDYREQFKSCGRDVHVADDVFIEHPEVMEVGDDVTLMSGFYMIGRPGLCRIGSHVNFYPNFFFQGDRGRFVLGDHVEFFPNNYISLGDSEDCFVEVGHHSHFAPACVLYGWGGLKIGPYCNVASHTVFATVGHHYEITDKPMALTGEKPGPITLAGDVWIAANVTVCANVTIAEGCVIGANAVVTKDTEPMGLYVGVPARRIRNR